MPFISTRTRQVHLQPLASQHHTTTKSRMFDSSYLLADVNGDKWLYAGCVLAVDSTTSKYVPYSSGASYGTDSDTPVCVTKDPYDMTQGAKAVTGVTHAELVEDYCYVFGAGRGSIPSAVKTALPLLQWV